MGYRLVAFAIEPSTREEDLVAALALLAKKLVKSDAAPSRLLASVRTSKRLVWFELHADEALELFDVRKSLSTTLSPFVSVIFHDGIGRFQFTRWEGKGRVQITTIDGVTGVVEGKKYAELKGETRDAATVGLARFYPEEPHGAFLEVTKRGARGYLLTEDGKPLVPPRALARWPDDALLDELCEGVAPEVDED